MTPRWGARALQNTGEGRCTRIPFDPSWIYVNGGVPQRIAVGGPLPCWLPVTTRVSRWFSSERRLEREERITMKVTHSIDGGCT